MAKKFKGKTGLRFDAAAAAGAFSGNAEELSKFIRAMNTYFERAQAAGSATISGIKAAADPNLAAIPQTVLVTQAVGETGMPDMGYTRLFDELDLRSSASTTFDVLDVNNGVTFEQLEPGEAAKTRDITTVKGSVGKIIYGAAMAFLDDWIRFNAYYKMDRVVFDVMRKEAHQKAANHYALFTALGAGIDIAFNTSVAKTIDAAADSILLAVGDALAVDEYAPMKILTNNRVNGGIVAQALAARFGSPNNNNQEVMTDIDELIISRKVAATYVILPGYTLQSGVWEDLNVEETRNGSVRGNTMDWREQYNAVIGNSGQVRRIALA